MGRLVKTGGPRIISLLGETRPDSRNGSGDGSYVDIPDGEKPVLTICDYKVMGDGRVKACTEEQRGGLFPNGLGIKVIGLVV